MIVAVAWAMAAFMMAKMTWADDDSFHDGAWAMSVSGSGNGDLDGQSVDDTFLERRCRESVSSGFVENRCPNGDSSSADLLLLDCWTRGGPRGRSNILPRLDA